VAGALAATQPHRAAPGGQRRELDRVERRACLERLDRSPLRQLLKLIRSTAQLSYYGDLGVLRVLGYDPERNLARGRALRVAEGRW
jgi:hypothetical protein